MAFEIKCYDKKEFENFKLHPICDDGVVVIKESEYWIDFAVMVWLAELSDGAQVYQCLWQGGGTRQLRECRHSYFGTPPAPWDEDKEVMTGYIFYLDGELFKKAIDVLSEYFDMK